MTQVNIARLREIAKVEFIDGMLYRHDNAPHQRWQSVSTFPHHFHDGAEHNVSASHLSRLPEQALRQFLEFARDKIQQHPRDSQ